MKPLSIALALATLGLLGAVVACSSAPDPVDAPTRTTTTEPPPAPTDPATPSEPEGASRVRYDLAAHLARAELRQGSTLVVDFGSPGAAKYTLGGWRTRVGDDVTEGDVTASAVESVTGFLLAPSDRDGPATLHLRARAVSDGRLTLYIDQQTIGHANLPTDGSYATVDVVLDTERFHRGENIVQLRVPSTGAPSTRRNRAHIRPPSFKPASRLSALTYLSSVALPSNAICDTGTPRQRTGNTCPSSRRRNCSTSRQCEASATRWSPASQALTPSRKAP